MKCKADTAPLFASVTAIDVSRWGGLLGRSTAID